jgi:hypothetical protein
MPAAWMHAGNDAAAAKTFYQLPLEQQDALLEEVFPKKQRWS